MYYMGFFVALYQAKQRLKRNPRISNDRKEFPFSVMIKFLSFHLGKSHKKA